MQTAAWHYNRALELERKGLCEEAVSAYREALRLDPADADAQVRLGLLLRELGRDAEANQAFQSALALRAGRSPGATEAAWQLPFVWGDGGLAAETE
ncbi:MAG: tetratricopeptide repeat protein [Acidobacteria bacterium]|nr:tetratricopeptide repeat protein [Acidobacteriota bacterium]